jgi:catechol-2,3-dioxygenase
MPGVIEALCAINGVRSGTNRAQLLPPNLSGLTMGHVHLNVRSVEAQQKFWVEQFGATVARSGVKLPGMLSTAGGDWRNGGNRHRSPRPQGSKPRGNC